METDKTVEELRAKLNEGSNKYQELLENSYSEALLQNEIQTKRWEAYKNDHVELSDRLLILRDKLSHNVMVPVGKRALMRGKLVHTNEIMVCLGDGWFAKQTAKQASDICHRRIQQCDEMLTKLRKEKELLSSRKSFPLESEAFCHDHETKEIIEPYDEEEEKQWREKHRQKEKEYRKKLAELKKVPKSKIETEDDLWRRLDHLDMQEELEDELDRLNEEIEDDDEEDQIEEEDSEDVSASDGETYKEEHIENNLQRRVSFKDQDNSGSEPKSDFSDNIIRIVFQHSDTPVSVPDIRSHEILNPSDIYSQYLKEKGPKSILKPSSVNYSPGDVEVENFRCLATTTDSKANAPLSPVEPTIRAVGEEVVEHMSAVVAATAVERPVSRFKAARMASKR